MLCCVKMGVWVSTQLNACHALFRSFARCNMPSTEMPYLMLSKMNAQSLRCFPLLMRLLLLISILIRIRIINILILAIIKILLCIIIVIALL